jgi:DNA-binding GntR family transcriptional regulator
LTKNLLDKVIALAYTKVISKPEKEFSRKVLRAHKRIYNAPLQRDIKKVYEEMARHIREVEKDLAAHKDRRIEKRRIDRIGRVKESNPIFSRTV